jgi:hypothetical protein
VKIKEGVLGVKDYGSRHPTSKRTWDTGGGEDPKRETDKWSAPALEAGRRRRSGTWNLAVLGTGRCMGFVRQIYLLLNINALNAMLNPICHLLALLGAHHIFDVSGLRVKLLKCCHFC